MNACVPCRLQHVEAERHVLRAQHTQLRHALHRPGNLELPPLYVDVSRYAMSRIRVCRLFTYSTREVRYRRYCARTVTPRFPLGNLETSDGYDNRSDHAMQG